MSVASKSYFLTVREHRSSPSNYDADRQPGTVQRAELLRLTALTVVWRTCAPHIGPIVPTGKRLVVVWPSSEVDEAWQMTYADLGGLGPLSGQVVLVGDPGQIAPVVTGDASRWQD